MQTHSNHLYYHTLLDATVKIKKKTLKNKKYQLFQERHSNKHDLNQFNVLFHSFYYCYYLQGDRMGGGKEDKEDLFNC